MAPAPRTVIPPFWYWLRTLLVIRPVAPLVVPSGSSSVVKRIPTPCCVPSKGLLPICEMVLFVTLTFPR